MGGLMSITGEPGRGPMRVGIPVADLTAGLFLAIGILVALIEREQSGEGQHVTTSLLQAQIAMLDFQASRWLYKQEVPKQAGNDHPTSIPTGVFKTADSYINIATTGHSIWERMCRAIGAEAMLENPDFASGALRSKNRKAVNAEIDKYLAGKSSAEWVEILNRAGVPCGPIYSVDQVFADPQVKHLQMDWTIATGDERGTLHVVGEPVSLSRTPTHLAAPPPRLGQHTDEVLAEFGFSAGEIKQLKQAKAV
jgi:formyl-CoA transferase